MMASWGARLAVQSLYAPALPFVLRTSHFGLISLAFLFSSPALIASRNPDPSISTLEIAAAIVWAIAFAGETTADRQMLRFVSTPENIGQVCRSGVWRVLPHAHAVFEETIWIALAVFAFASPWGWIAAACPAVMLYLLVTRRC
jgi:steroid 5-alpha reductase family enzyme